MLRKVNPKIDLVFKKLFGSEENKDILLSLINAILPDSQQISALELKNPYNVSDYAEGKLTILDIKAEDENGNLYDIEMQIKGAAFYGKRTLYYWAKIFGSQLDRLTEEDIEKKEKNGRSYTDLNKCIVISLMDFEFFADDRYHRCFMLKDRESNETHLDLDYLDLYFIELEKFEKKHKPLKTILDRWIKFLNNADIYSRDNLPQELAEIEPIKKANERLTIMYFDEKERAYYEAQQKRYLDEYSRQVEFERTFQEAMEKALQEAKEKAEAELEKALKEAEAKQEKALKEAREKAEAEREKSVQEAKEKAEFENKLNIAKNAINRGLDNATISALTGLSIVEIGQLREEKN